MGIVLRNPNTDTVTFTAPGLHVVDPVNAMRMIERFGSYIKDLKLVVYVGSGRKAASMR